MAEATVEGIEAPNSEEGPVGIGGWLVLPAIGLVLGLLIGIGSLLFSLSLFQDVARAGFAEVLGFHLLVATGLLVYQAVAASRFFQKQSSAPQTMINLMGANVVAGVVLLLGSVGADAEVFAIEDAKGLFQSVVSAAIWIPYFRSSKRVAATFVE